MKNYSPLAKLIRDSREALDLSQAELAKKVGVDAAVNVSKWESGTPIPWHRLDALLKALPNIPADQYWELQEKHNEDAMKRYRSNRRKREGEAVRESPAGILDFLIPRVRQKIELLHAGSSYVSVETMITAACEWYADLALAHGLLSDLTPNVSISPSVSTIPVRPDPTSDELKKSSLATQAERWSGRSNTSARRESVRGAYRFDR